MPIAYDRGWRALARGLKTAIHDCETIIFANEGLFDQYCLRMLFRAAESLDHFLRCAKIQKYSVALPAVKRLHDDWHADVLRRQKSLIRIFNDVPVRNGDCAIGKKPLG